LRRGSGRPTTSHEWIFVLAKTAAYYWDSEAIRSNAAQSTLERDRYRGNGHSFYHDGNADPKGGGLRGLGGLESQETNQASSSGRNARTSDWFFDSLRAILDGENMLLQGEGGEPLALAVNPKGFPEAHFATYPERLIEPLIKAGTPERGCCSQCGQPWVRVVERAKYEPEVVPVGIRNVDASRGDKTRKLSGDDYNKQASSITLGFRPSCACGVAETTPAIVLDPFIGSGTTAVVAKKLGRRYIGVDLNPDYVAMAERRLGRILI